MHATTVPSDVRSARLARLLRGAREDLARHQAALAAGWGGATLADRAAATAETEKLRGYVTAYESALSKLGGAS